MNHFKNTGLTDQFASTMNAPFHSKGHQRRKEELKVQFEEDEEDEQCQSMEEDDSDEEEEREYREKLEKYKKMSERQPQIRRDQEEDEEPNILKPKIVEPIAKGNKSTLVGGHDIRKDTTRIGNSTVMPQQSSRPRTSHSYKPNVKLTKKVRANDPVSLYQKFNSTWKKDSFLNKGANRKQGRKLQLSQRNRLFGLLY